MCGAEVVNGMNPVSTRDLGMEGRRLRRQAGNVQTLGAHRPITLGRWTTMVQRSSHCSTLAAIARSSGHWPL